MENENHILLLPIDGPAGWLNDLTVSPPGKLRKGRPTARVLRELPYMPKHSPNEFRRRDGIIKRDVVGDGLKVAKGGLCPDYFSHRARRCFA